MTVTHEQLLGPLRANYELGVAYETFREHIHGQGVVEIARISEEEWLRERLLGIGGSDFTDLTAGDDYACPRKLYYQKTTTPDYKRDDFALRRGRRLEVIARNYYQETTGRQVLSGFGTFVNQRFNHQRFNPDGIFKDPSFGWAVCEYKVLGKSGDFGGECSFEKIKKHGLPKGYLAQAQWAAGLLGLKLTSYGIYQPLLDELLVIDVPFDPDIFKILCDLADKAWAEIQNKTPPEGLPAMSSACRTCDYRKQCKGLNSSGTPFKTKTA